MQSSSTKVVDSPATRMMKREMARMCGGIKLEVESGHVVVRKSDQATGSKSFADDEYHEETDNINGKILVKGLKKVGFKFKITSKIDTKKAQHQSC